MYKADKESPINKGNFHVLNIDLEYSVIKLITELPAIKYAFKKLLCSLIETNKV